MKIMSSVVNWKRNWTSTLRNKSFGRILREKAVEASNEANIRIIKMQTHKIKRKVQSSRKPLSAISTCVHIRRDFDSIVAGVETVESGCLLTKE
jgi:hypothetical protein